MFVIVVVASVDVLLFKLTLIESTIGWAVAPVNEVVVNPKIGLLAELRAPRTVFTFSWIVFPA